MHRPFLLTLALAGSAVAHGDHGGQAPMVNEDADWMTKHMAGTSDIVPFIPIEPQTTKPIEETNPVRRF